MPAAAVIPAPIAYINVVAVKKLVVEYLVRPGLIFSPWFAILAEALSVINLAGFESVSFTVNKLGCLKQALA